MAKLALFLLLFCSIISVGSSLYEQEDDAFPGDFLTPYKEHGLHRTKRSQSTRETKGCEPVLYGNSSYEQHPSSLNSLFKYGFPFIQTHNFLHEFTEFGQKKSVYGHVTLADNPLRTFSVLEPGKSGGCKNSIRATVADSSKQRKCVAAINAGYFRTLNGHCLGNIVSDAKLVQDSGGIQNANFGIRSDGNIVVGYLSQDEVLDQNKPFVQLVSGVVWLLRNGQVYVDESKKAECRETEETGSMDLFANVVSARTAIGHDSRGRVVLVQVDGKTHRRGINLYDFAKLLKKFDVVNAINLDGGGSSTFVINETTVNYPSDECGAYICPRKVSSIACIHEPDCVPADCGSHGVCQMGKCVCDGQWAGPACDVPLCKLNNCSSNGACTEDGCLCFLGWSGEKCDQACHAGFYGVNCSGTCRCQNGGACDHKYGSCTCLPGWTGQFCEQDCPPGSFGQDCKQVCNCTQSCVCHKETGQCLGSTHLPVAFQKLITCLSKRELGDQPVATDSSVLDLTQKDTQLHKDYRQLFVWFIGVISLCGVSLVANLVLIYLQCTNATRTVRQRRHHEETAFLFSPDEEEL